MGRAQDPQIKRMPISAGYFSSWKHIWQVAPAWSETEKTGRSEGKDGTGDNRQLEGKGRKMKHPQS